MRIFKAVLLFFLLGFLSQCTSTTSDLGIIAGTLVDGTGGKPKRNVLVLVNGGTIQAIVPKSELDSHPVRKLIDASDKYLLPGLFDMHGHVTMTHREASLEENRPQFTVTYRKDVAEWMLRQLLFYGITTVRETADFLEEGIQLKKELLAGSIPGPRMFTCGPLLEAPPPVFRTMSAVVSTEAEARAEVRREVEAGVDFVKIYASLPLDLARAVVQEAHAHNTRVLAHLGTTTWKEAAEVGVDAFVHANPVPQDILTEKQLKEISDPKEFLAFLAAFKLFEPEGQPAQELFEVMKQKNIANDPNLVVYRNMAGNSSFLSEEQGEEMKAVPSFLMEGWQQELGSGTLPISQESIHHMMRFVKAAYDAGVPLLVGSDLANPNTLPGLSLHQELELLVQAGIPPLIVLRMATHDAAEWLGILQEVGTVEPGKQADLVILNKDPMENIRNTRDIHSVIQAGKVVDRTSLATMGLPK